jgi:hypothetical protein
MHWSMIPAAAGRGFEPARVHSSLPVQPSGTKR